MYIQRNLESLIALLAYSTIFSIQYICKLDNAIFLGLLASVATIYFGILKYKIENDRIFKELFSDFNKRYDKNFNDLINELKKNKEKKLTLKDEKLIIDYFNLCAEEYLWTTKNRIPKSVWNAWKSGIKENLKVKQVEEIFKIETETENGKNSYYGLVKDLKS